MRKIYKIKNKDIKPGEYIFVGKKQDFKPTMQLFAYNEKEFIEDKGFSLKENSFKSGYINWLNVHGISDVQLIESVAKKIGLNSLNLQDLLNTNERPKVEENENYIFFTAKSIHFNENNKIESEQISLVLGENFIVSFQEKPSKFFEHIRTRIRENLGIVRKKNADYLLFLLLDTIIDNYYTCLDIIYQQVDNFEEIVLDKPTENLLVDIEAIKKEVNSIKLIALPLKEAIIRLSKVNPEIIDSNNSPYFSDLKDSVLGLLDFIEQLKNNLSGITNIYLSSLSNKMNSVMKLLTIISTIFMPLTFIVGVYGMNFDYMPELKYKYAYPIVMLIMLIISILMVFYFKKKKIL